MKMKLMLTAAALMMTLVAFGARPSAAQAKRTTTTAARNAWALGADLTTVALMHAKGTGVDEGHWLRERCRRFARYFGADVPALPKRTDDTIKDTAAAMDYSLRTCFQSLAGRIQRTHGTEAAMLFEAALKLNLLLGIYCPGRSEGESIVNVVEKRLKRTRLPVSAIAAVAKKVRAEAPFDEVCDAVLALRESIANELRSKPLVIEPTRKRKAPPPKSVRHTKTPEPTKNQIAWKFGADLTTMALLHASGMDEGDRREYLKRCRLLAGALGLNVPALPKLTGDKVKDTALALAYVLRTCFKPMARKIERASGIETARLFEVALKLNLLLTIYYPGSDEASVVVKVAAKRLKGTCVPVSMIASITEKIHTKAPTKEVMRAVFAVRKAVAKKLAEQARPAPRHDARS